MPRCHEIQSPPPPSPRLCRGLELGSCSRGSCSRGSLGVGLGTALSIRSADSLPPPLSAPAQYLRMPGERIMKLAEELYQAGVISYPRTETDEFDQQQYDLKVRWGVGLALQRGGTPPGA